MYIFDPTYVGETKKSVSGVDISVYRDFAIGMSFEEHRKVFGSYYPENDFYSETDEYNPGMYYYLSEMTYDGTHDLVLSSKAEAQDYYDYLLETVFSQPAEYRTITLFYSVDRKTWESQYNSQMIVFLNATGVPYSIPNPETINRQGVSGVMVTLVFGK